MSGITMAILFATLSGIIFGSDPPKNRDTLTSVICAAIFASWIITGFLAFFFAIMGG